VNISGTPLAAGDSFQLFVATSYSGAFTSLTPAVPGPTLAWDTTQLSQGKLKVIVAPARPVINNIGMSAGNLMFSGTNGLANAGYNVLVSTNLTTPLTNWAVLATNTFDANGAFSVSNSINSNVPQQYYLIELQ
jgi:hypothetical protein